MMAALRDCMPMTSWLVLTMYFCFFCLTCRYVIEGPGGKIFSVISFIIGGTVIAMDTGESTAGGIICLLGVLNLASHRPYFGRKVAPRYVTAGSSGCTFLPLPVWNGVIVADGRVCFLFRVLHA